MSALAERADAVRQTRSSGRLASLGPAVALVTACLALAGLTQVQRAWSSPGPAVATADPAVGDGGAAVRLSFGSVTSQGALLFEVRSPAHLRSFDAAGAPHWQRDLDDGQYITCGPCPAAILRQADGRALALTVDGSETSPPVALVDLVATTSLAGTVLATRQADGSVTFFTPTSAGLVAAGQASDAGLDRSLVVVTPARRGGAVTVMRASADPLRQGEFEIEHVTPAGAHTETVALDGPQSRPQPCALDDAGTVAYEQLGPGPTADGVTHVVARLADGHRVDAQVTGTFDTCVAGAAGVVLTATANGADGDLTHSEVDVVWIDPSGSVRSSTSEQVQATTASVAVDGATGRVAVAGGSGPAVVLTSDRRTERPSARAVAFDDQGGWWWATDADHVRREEPS